MMNSDYTDFNKQRLSEQAFTYKERKGDIMTDQERFHSLDAVRGLALLLGIVLHSTMSFFLAIPRMDSSPSTTLAVSFFVIHIFRMSVFFFIAGFFAHMVFHRKGWAAFMKDRAKRIGIPLLAGLLILVPVTMASILWGLSLSSWPEALLSTLKGQFIGTINWSHLWFLYYLLIFYVLSFAFYWIFDRFIDRTERLRLFIDKMTSLAVGTCCAPILLAIPVFLWFYFNKSWFPWMGIISPDNSFTPNMTALIGYGTCFSFGWILNRQTRLLSEMEKHWMLYLGIAIALSVFCLSQVGTKPDMLAMLMGKSQLEGLSRFLYTAAYSTAIWFWTFGIVGAAIRFCSGFSSLRRYLADSSYWLYLMHLPVIFPLQVLMAGLPLHWTLKFSTILGITVVLGLFSYKYLVRSTLIGALLNGRRYQRAKKIEKVHVPQFSEPGSISSASYRVPSEAPAG
jgi:glucan biosynthesis protein C